MSEKTDMQKTLLEMMAFFHKYCTSNNLRYYIIGGTMLGAVRHKGFIPWDDDIDVGMPRNDYERLISILKQSEDGEYRLESVDSIDENYCYPYAKLYDTSTTLIENTRKRLKRGVYLDIFPLDGVGDIEKEAHHHYAKIERLKKILVIKKIQYKKQRAHYKNLMLLIAQQALDFIISEKKLCSIINNLCKTKSFDKCTIVGNLVGAWGWKEIMPREVFGTPTLYKFESLEVYGPEIYDRYLTIMYGDWRKLPPKEKCVSHHDYVLDLNKSYLD